MRHNEAEGGWPLQDSQKLGPDFYLEFQENVFACIHGGQAI